MVMVLRRRHQMNRVVTDVTVYRPPFRYSPFARLRPFVKILLNWNHCLSNISGFTERLTAVRAGKKC